MDFDERVFCHQDLILHFHHSKRSPILSQARESTLPRGDGNLSLCRFMKEPFSREFG